MKITTHKYSGVSSTTTIRVFPPPELHNCKQQEKSPNKLRRRADATSRDMRSEPLTPSKDWPNRVIGSILSHVSPV